MVMKRFKKENRILTFQKMLLIFLKTCLTSSRKLMEITMFVVSQSVQLIGLKARYQFLMQKKLMIYNLMQARVFSSSNQKEKSTTKLQRRINM